MELKEKILYKLDQHSFEEIALEVFDFQFRNCKVFRDFSTYLKKTPKSVKTIQDIPFLPIEFFKTHSIVSNTEKVQKIFTSSGTTGMQTSKHYVTDLKLYEVNSVALIEELYGNLEEYTILALLPSYLERSGSSLVYMVEHFMNKSKGEHNGFYLNNHFDLFKKLNLLEKEKRKVLLIGVSFGLLDFIKSYDIELNHTIVMETGGMKGRRKEIIREELHQILKKGFGVDEIHSEYGMTELLSQAYSYGNGIFTIPKSMRILVRDPEDPLSYYSSSSNQVGGLNIIDLANLNSCSFIATQDLGQMLNKKKFKILGRFDNSDIRGCNLLSLKKLV